MNPPRIKIVRQLFAKVLWLGCLAYLVVLLCVALSNFSIFDPNWPFGLFASFTPTLLFCLPVVLFIAFRRSVYLFVVILIASLFAFYRFVSFDEYVAPTGKSCKNDVCTTIVMTNLRRSETAVSVLAAELEGRFDILVLTEVPAQLSESDLEALFGGTMLRPPNLEQKLGSRLAVISRFPEGIYSIAQTVVPQGETTPRAFLKVQPENYDATRPQIIGVHPVWPKTASRMAARDNYLKSLSTSLVGENFVIIGDFNLTPWEPMFSALPGQRAGNPRWLRTWNANDPFQRLVIDHALVGSGLEVVETDVLNDVGSDHFPIRVVVKANE